MPIASWIQRKLPAGLAGDVAVSVCDIKNLPNARSFSATYSRKICGLLPQASPSRETGILYSRLQLDDDGRLQVSLLRRSAVSRCRWIASRIAAGLTQENAPGVSRARYFLCFSSVVPAVI